MKVRGLVSHKLKGVSRKRCLMSFSQAPVRPCSRVLLFAFLRSSVALLVFVLPAFSQQRWERNYGGTGYDDGWSVQQTSDMGYIVAGYTECFGIGGQIYLVKTNAQGDTLWTRNYGGTGEDRGYSVQQTSDTGYVVAGTTYLGGGDGQVYLVKTNAQGDTLWTRYYGGASFDYSESVQQTQDGGYIVAGYTSSFGNGYQVYLVKTNASGDTLWTRNYGGASNDYGEFVQQTQDGGYIVAGASFSFGDSAQVYLIKTDASGDTLWTRNYGGTAQDMGYSVQQTQDRGYIVAGGSNSFGNDWYDVYLIKTDASGDTLWTRTYGGSGDDMGYSVQQTQDGGYIVAGSLNGAQVYLVKTNAFGDTLWTKTYGGTSDDWGKSVQQTQDGGYIVAGTTCSFGNRYQVYLIKTDSLGRSTGVEETSENRGQGLEVRITATPNPYTFFATVPGHETERFSLYDVSGRKVGVFKGDRIGSGLSAGIYFLKPEGKDSKPLRIVKLR